MLYLDLESTRLRLRALVNRWGHGRWRCPDDLIDTAFDRTIDGVVSGHYPARALVPISVQILKNLVRSGPQRVELDRCRVATLPGDPRPTARHHSAGESDALRARLRRLTGDSLSCRERHTFEALLHAETIRAAARETRASPRDVRTRLRRIASKLGHEDRVRRHDRV